jgi:hypothetical protein
LSRANEMRLSGHRTIPGFMPQTRANTPENTLNLEVWNGSDGC